MRLLAVLGCAGYWILLTALLLAPNPADVVGLREVPAFPWGDFGIHFTALMILSVLAHATRWPKRPAWLLLAILLIYAVATESLQALVPPRTVELKDYVENILGVLAGTGCYWLAVRVLGRELPRSEVAREMVQAVSPAGE